MKIQQVLKLKSLRWGVAATAAGVAGALSYAAFIADEQPIAAAGALEFSTFDLSGGAAVAFRGDYIRATWDGDLVAYNMATTGATTVKWKAQTRLAAQSWSTRRIATHDGSNGVPFRWNMLTTTQQTALGDATEGPLILDYLHGDASNERTAANPSGSYRDRYSLLGAVIHSRPYYVNYADAGVARVYVGANDGMLHSFNAVTGDEVFAYVPSMLFGKLKDLTTPSATTFKYYVDGMMSIRDVIVSGVTKTLLVSGLGGGGKGLFALDVSDPSPSGESAVAAMAKWELTDASTGYANLGNVYAAPQIVKLNSGASVALVPNGLNSSSGVSSLFVINVSTGAKIGEIPAGTGPDNGLGGIAAVDLDHNGTVDAVYAGDLKGTLWKFNLAGGSLPSAATALFTPASGTERPITAAPSVVAHPRGGVLVNFGTGKVYASSDLVSTTTEYIYGIWDGAGATTSVLASPTLSEVSVTVNSLTNKYRAASASSVNYVAGDKGWRVSLTGGERLLGGDTLTDSGRYMVTTTIPNDGSTQGAWLLQFDALTGGTPSTPFFDVNSDGKVSTTDNTDKVTVSGSPVAPVGKFLGSGVWSQPVLAKYSASLDLPFFNENDNTRLPPTTTVVVTPPAGERGVYGGHFDFDIYYNACDAQSSKYSKSCTNTHVHEYDDIYDVVGVNMLKASEPKFNLLNAIASTTTSFKVLVSNTKWSPAASLKVSRPQGANATNEPAVNIDTTVWNLPLSPEGFLANTSGGDALTFTRGNLPVFVYYLPVTAFTNKDWGTGEVRAGLMPTQTGCVHANTGGSGSSNSGWMNGALTIQVVAANTANSAIEATLPSAAGGYRLKKDSTSQGKQLAQYTTFWHHPNGKCIDDSGWTKAPPADTVSNATSKAPAAGSADPTGLFMVGTNGELIGGQLGSTTTYQSFNGVEVLVIRTFDANGVTQTLKNKATGAVVDITLLPWGTLTASDKQSAQRARLGRLSWRELVR